LLHRSCTKPLTFKKKKGTGWIKINVIELNWSRKLFVKTTILLALMIEMFKKDGSHKIPTNRSDLYDSNKQAEGIIFQHQSFRHLVALPTISRDTHLFNGPKCPTLLDMTTHRIFHDTEHFLYRQAKSDFRCLEALGKSLCASVQVCR